MTYYLKLLIVLVTTLNGQIYINELMSSNISTIYDDSDNSPDWIELYNDSNSAIDLNGYSISDNFNDPFKFIFPNIIINPNDYLLVFASGDDTIIDTYLHTNFKLSSEGEVLVLTNSQGQTIDSIEFSVLPPDVSYGRESDGDNNWVYFTESTPLNSNNTNGYTLCQDPEFSKEGGFYNNPININLSHSEPIYYTLDGSEPDLNSSIYTSSISIDETTVLRTVIIDDDCLSYKINTHTYFIDVDSDLPIISLVTDPPNLWDNETGIYVMGDNAEDDWPHKGANFWQDWEKPIHIEFFETNKAQTCLCWMHRLTIMIESCVSLQSD